MKINLNLKETRELFDTLTSNMLDGLVVIDWDGNILFANKAVYQIVGLKPRRSPRNFNMAQFLHPEDLQKALEIHMLAKAGKAGSLTQYRIITHKHDQKWIEAIGRHVSFGGQDASLVTLRDITEQKKAEKALKESEERFRVIHEASFGGIGIHDKGIILDCNHGLADITGYSMDELIGMNGLDLIAPKWRDQVLQNIVTGHEKPYDVEGVRKDGTNYPLEIIGKNIPYHGRTVRVTEFRDLSGRKQEQEALCESEDRYRKIVAAITDYIYTVHVEGGRAVYTEHSPACEAVTGYRVDEFNTDPFLWFTMVAQDDRERVREYFNKVLMDKHSGPVEHRIFHKNGSVRWVANMPVVHRDEAGAIISYDGVLSDITERKNAEEAIRQRQAKLDSIFRAAPTGIGVVTNRVLQEVNDRICTMTGYSREELVGIPARILYPTQEDHDYVGSEKYRQISEKGTGTVETHWKKKDGTIIDILLSSTPILPGDLLAGVTFTALDITERKQTEEALREGEERYRLMAELTGKLVYDYDVPSGRITWHGAISRITGYSPEEFGAVDIKAFNEMIHPEDRTDVVIILEAALKGCGPYNAEYRLRKKDGSYIFVEDHGVFLSDGMGRAVRMLGSLGDISVRKQAEEALRKSEERFRSLIQSSLDIIVILDKNRYITYESPSMEQVLKYPAGEMIGKTPLDYIHPEDVGTVVTALAEVFEEVNPGVPTEFRFQRADGTWAHLEAIGNNLIDYPGINGVVITARDITERKKAEEQKLDMERRLLHAQKLESLGVMAGGIAHDFNNLLMAILGNLDLARLDLSPVSRSRPFIDQALKAARRAADLTNQMLAYSGKGRFELKPFDLSELVQEMARLLKASISKTVTLNLQMQANLPSIVADPSQIQQIIMNLIVNASEAVGEHPGVVTITTGALECDQGYLQDSRLKEKPNPGTYVFIEVRDTGCGMDDETKDRLFDPFFTTKFTGRGLGMAAVLGIVSGHKGAIMVESEPGKGTTIRVMFPASQAKRTPKGIKSGVSAVGLENGAMAPASGMVLIADDEDMVRDLCRAMVERLGYKVITASDGEETVKIFHEHADEIVCVILDLTMPKLDGLAAYDELRRIKPDVKVIISSGYDEQETTDRFAGKGLAGFIKKPYQLSSLGTELTRVLKDL